MCISLLTGVYLVLSEARPPSPSRSFVRPKALLPVSLLLFCEEESGRVFVAQMIESYVVLGERRRNVMSAEVRSLHEKASETTYTVDLTPWQSACIGRLFEAVDKSFGAAATATVEMSNSHLKLSSRNQHGVSISLVIDKSKPAICS